MTEAKKQRNRERQEKLLAMFEGDFYQEKKVGDEYYIKSWNGGTEKWQVAIYSAVSYRRYKSFNKEKLEDCQVCKEYICKCVTKPFKAPTLFEVQEIVKNEKTRN